MQTKFWIRRIVLAIVWGLAVSTWASIAHYLFGMPDAGLILVVGTIVFILVRPTQRAPSTSSNTETDPMHAGAPTA